jgi:hypothetical protein
LHYLVIVIVVFAYAVISEIVLADYRARFKPAQVTRQAMRIREAISNVTVPVVAQIRAIAFAVVAPSGMAQMELVREIHIANNSAHVFTRAQWEDMTSTIMQQFQFILRRHPAYGAFALRMLALQEPHAIVPYQPNADVCVELAQSH